MIGHDWGSALAEIPTHLPALGQALTVTYGLFVAAVHAYTHFLVRRSAASLNDALAEESRARADQIEADTEASRARTIRADDAYLVWMAQWHDEPEERGRLAPLLASLTTGAAVAVTYSMGEQAKPEPRPRLTAVPTSPPGQDSEHAMVG